MPSRATSAKSGTRTRPRAVDVCLLTTPSKTTVPTAPPPRPPPKPAPTTTTSRPASGSKLIHVNARPWSRSASARPKSGKATPQHASRPVKSASQSHRRTPAASPERVSFDTAAKAADVPEKAALAVPGGKELSSAKRRFSKSANAIFAMIRFKNAMAPQPPSSVSTDLPSAHQPPGTTPALENTYRLGPPQDGLFRPSAARQAMQRLLDRLLGTYTYDSATVPGLVKTVSGEVTRAMRATTPPRYRLVCNVLMVEQRGQTMAVSSRCLWNSHTDNHATASYSRPTFSLTVSLHAVYLD